MNSGKNKIDSFVHRHTKIGFDSNILIALVEANSHYGLTAKGIFKLFEQYQNEVWTSVITIPEVTIKPLLQKRYDIATIYNRKLNESTLSLAEIKPTTARLATELGVYYKLKTKDALIIASLIEVEVTGFITADKDFERVKEVDVLLIG